MPLHKLFDSIHSEQ